MKFKEPQLEMEFNAMHPDVRRTVMNLDVWSREQGIPEVVVTQVLRSDADQESIYTRHADALIAKLRNGARLPPADKALAEKLEAMSAAGRRKWARERFSWHKIGAAADLRNKHYTPAQLAAVMAHLRTGRAGPDWEILSHDVHSGSHLHVGRKDFLYRKDFEQQMETAKEMKANA